MCVLGMAHPFAEIGRNYAELLSELVILLITDLLLQSSDPALSPNARMLLGWSIIGLLCA